MRTDFLGSSCRPFRAIFFLLWADAQWLQPAVPSGLKSHRELPPLRERTRHHNLSSFRAENRRQPLFPPGLNRAEIDRSFSVLHRIPSPAFVLVRLQFIIF